jgi:deoxynucleoside triphosphate triphosphohydrolase SAMHD1
MAQTWSQELEEARSIMRRVLKRDLYRLVDENVFDWASHDALKAEVTPELITAAAKSLFVPSSPALSMSISAASTTTTASAGMTEGGTDSAEALIALAQDLTVEHVIVDIARLHYGMKDRNPIDFVKFYSKHKPNG